MPILSNSKHERFAQEVAQGASASAAYVTAGYSKNDSNAARLNGNERVRSRIEEILSEGATKAGVTVQRVVEELAKIAFSDIRKVARWGRSPIDTTAEHADPNGLGVYPVELVPSEQIDDAMAAAVAEVSLTQTGVKVKLHDKLGALEKLGKHLGMFKEKVELSGPGGGPVQTVNTAMTAQEAADAYAATLHGDG